MFDQYTIVMHKKLELVYMVPNEWPARAEPLLMNLVEKIIEKFDFSSPIVRINDISTRLIRYTPPAGVYYVFERISKKEIIGAYAYDIIVPENGKAIIFEITSGSTLSPATWSPPPLQHTSTHVDQIYRYLSSPKLRRKVLSIINSNKDTANQCRLWRKRLYQERKHNCWDKMRYKRASR